MWEALSNPTQNAAKGIAGVGGNIAMPHCSAKQRIENIGIDLADCAEFRFVTEKRRRGETRRAAKSSLSGPVSEQLQSQKKPSFFGL
ncbi:hypothetical protein [Bradyrhizobium sp.]|uniref:hypothetical protein n=1 Tax=Bradyrhizobium sp. TaxID=376 RepID=UPI004037CC4B